MFLASVSFSNPMKWLDCSKRFRILVCDANCCLHKDTWDHTELERFPFELFRACSAKAAYCRGCHSASWRRASKSVISPHVRSYSSLIRSHSLKYRSNSGAFCPMRWARALRESNPCRGGHPAGRAPFAMHPKEPPGLFGAVAGPRLCAPAAFSRVAPPAFRR